VAWGVLNAGRRPPRSRFVKVPLDLRDANGLAALAMICTVVPGTVVGTGAGSQHSAAARLGSG
jgi:multicomponent K+:H+ antiporter subunit E